MGVISGSLTVESKTIEGGIFKRVSSEEMCSLANIPKWLVGSEGSMRRICKDGWIYPLEDWSHWMRFVACFASMSTLASNFFAKARVHGDDMDKKRRRNAKTWDVIFMRLLIWIWIAMIDLI